MKFSSASYYPRYQNHLGVYNGYTLLSDAHKSAFIPIFEISQRKAGDAFSKSIAEVEEVTGDDEFILDIGPFTAPRAFRKKGGGDAEAEAKADALQAKQDRFNTNRSSLFQADSGFKNWRDVVARFPNAIPVLQYSDIFQDRNSIIRQAALLQADGFTRLAIKIDVQSNLDSTNLGVVGNLIALMGGPTNLLIILNAGIGRNSISRKVDGANTAIRVIQQDVALDERAKLNFCFFGESRTKPNKKGKFYIEDKYWGVLEEITTEGTLSQGDYASMPPAKRQSSYVTGDWLAKVSYPVEAKWITFRDPNARDNDGWVTGAQQIHEDEDFEDLPPCAGRDLFMSAVSGSPESTSPREWYSARVNMHVVRQLEYFGLL